MFNQATADERRGCFLNIVWDTCRKVCAIALTVKLKLTLTLTLTLTDTRGAVLTPMLGYRSLYITCTTPQWVVLQNSMPIEFAHIHPQCTMFILTQAAMQAKQFCCRVDSR